MSLYKEEKLKEFHKKLIEEYKRDLIIENIIKVIPTEITDGKFTQIGIRPLINEDIFILPNFDERLPGAGRYVAIGELDFLIKNILDKKEIEKIKFKEYIKEFPKHVFNNAIILLSTKFYVEVFTKLMNRIDYEEKYPRLDKRYRILPVSEKILGDKIIILDKDAILWEKQKFHNEFTNNDEKIDIKIKPASNGKVDITIRSVNKIKYIDTELIKVLEIEE